MDLINNSLAPVTTNSTLEPSQARAISTADRENFRVLLRLLTGALAHIDTVYPALTDAAEPFDKELARKIEAAKKADAELLTYLKSKMERGEALPPGIVPRLLGR